MNMLFIQPPKLEETKDSRGTIPISLIYLASAIRQIGHTPYILDFTTHSVPTEANLRQSYIQKLCKSYITDNNIDLIGINCFSTMHFPLVLEIAKEIKQMFNIPICIGGAHPTFFPKEIVLNCENVDFVISGEGEDSLILLLETLSKENKDLTQVPALTFKDSKNNIIENPRTGYIPSLKESDMPAWDLIDLPKYYGNYSSYYNPKNLDFKLSVPIITSRSCPYNCSFCSAHLIMGQKYRIKTASQVVDEIQYLHEERKENYFSFMDDIINLNPEHIIEICNEIVKRNLNIQFSINQGLYIARVVDEVIDALAAAGMVTVSLPIEHGDEKLRRSILKKKLTDEKIYQVVERIQKYDIFTVGLSIMGFPEETKETLEKTLKMIHTLKLDVNSVASLIPFPRTPVYDQAKRDNLFLKEMSSTWEGNDFFDPQNKTEFFIKPYNLDMDTLFEYRKIFNSLYFYSDRAKSLNKVS